MQSPFAEFLKKHFPEVIKAWKLDDESWNKMFHWYLSTNNMFQFMRANDLIGFVMYRPVTEEQMLRLHQKFEWDPEGKYLYVPLFAVKKEWKGSGMWNLMKGIARHTYPNVEFIIYENFRTGTDDLKVVPINRGKNKETQNGKAESTRSTASRTTA